MARYSTYAPDFQVRINGEPLPAAVRATVGSIRYEDGLNAADRVEISLANPNLRWLQRHIKGFGFSPPTGVNVGPVRVAQAAPAGTFDLDNRLQLAIGYAPDPLDEVFEGDVTGVEVNFPNGGMPTLNMVAHDYLQRLSRGSNARGFGPLPDMLVAAILGAKNLLIPQIDPTLVSENDALFVLDHVFKGTGLKQAASGSGQTDLQLLQAIAAKYDANYWVDGDVIHLSRFLKDFEPRLTLTWGQSLLDFSPKVSTIGQVAAVSMKFTLRVIPLDFLVTVSWDFDRESVGISIVPGKAVPASPPFRQPTQKIVDRPITTPADIARSAMTIYSKLREKLNARLTGSGSAIGDPRIRAGAMIRLDGLGPDFSGNYRVASATHAIDSGGYKTNFQVYKEILP